MLGWDVDLAFGVDKLQVLLLPEDKRLHFVRRFEAWLGAGSLSLLELCELTGIINFLSQGIPVFKSFMAHLIPVRTGAFAAQARRRQNGVFLGLKAVVVPLDQESMSTLRRMTALLRTHGGVCPMLLRLGPGLGWMCTCGRMRRVVGKWRGRQQRALGHYSLSLA